MLWNRQDIVGTDVSAHHHCWNSDSRSCAVATHVESLQRRFVTRKHLGSFDSQSVGARRLTQEATMSLWRAHHLQDDPLLEVRDLLLDGSAEEVPGLCLLLLVLFALLVQMSPVSPRFCGRRVGMQDMVAFWCKFWIEHGRAAHEDSISRCFEIRPIIEDSPLCRKLCAMTSRQSICFETKVDVNEGFQQSVLAPSGGKILLEIRGGSTRHQLLRDLPICIAHDRITSSDHSAILQADACCTVVLHNDLLNLCFK
mmetsp:Transcript_21781/g.39051  ORF Transcript_21781/g.39051 Transcript_21781/m.39051 type:complete len:255 (-) Transcript_21781:756-1520(-)